MEITNGAWESVDFFSASSDIFFSGIPVLCEGGSFTHSHDRNILGTRGFRVSEYFFANCYDTFCEDAYA